MRLTRVLLMCLSLSAVSLPAKAASDRFEAWLSGVRQEAAQKGVSQKTINTALGNIQHNQRIIDLDHKQPESRITFPQYKKNVITQTRIDRGRRLLRENRALLNRVSAAYSVQPEMIVALWGMESNYGSNTGGFGVIEALATLAYDGRRSDFFRDQLFRALQIIDEGDISFENMTGSWAGAMGQNQFMPLTFQEYAVDGDGNGSRDIWTSLPDVFASTANYLHHIGWHGGERWGRAVRLEQQLPKSLTGIRNQKSLVEWAHMGVTLPNGGPLPTADGMYASLVIPDGSDTGYLVYNNYNVIMNWNKSIYFATSVGLLSDLIAEAK